MPAAERLNDPDSAGGVITAVAQGTVFVNGLPLSVNGSAVAPHTPFTGPHLSPQTANGSSNVFAENKPANRVGDADTCGHTRASGSPNVFIN